MPILAVDLNPVNTLLMKASEAEAPNPDSLVARLIAALQAFTHYTPIVDFTTLRTCTQAYSEYELLDGELQELQNAALRTETTETLLENARTKISNLRAIFVRLAAITATGTPSDSKLPKPKTFIEERDKLREFLRQVRLNASTIRDPQARLRYAVSLLSSLAYDQVHPYVRADRVALNDLKDLLTILKNVFKNLNRRLDAKRKLTTLRQENRDFATFYTEF